MYDSERELRQWLSYVQFTSSDLAPALALLEATGKIGRHAAKPNSSRAGWLIVNGNGTVEPAESIAGPVAIPATAEVPEPVESPTTSLADEQRIGELATAIIEAFNVPGR
jgi:hypothetical protein